MHKHILIVGGAGFVGSTLAIAIKERWPEVSVTALDNLHRQGSELNPPRLKAADVAFVHGDIRCLSDLLSVKPLPDLIIECSAEPSAQAGYADSPEYLINTNTVGCFHCLELARRAKADIIFVSTSRVYPYRTLNAIPFVEEETRYRWDARKSDLPGFSEHGIAENFPLTGVRSLYGMTKLTAELMIQEYADAYDLGILINRAGLLAGPWQMARSDQGILSFWMGGHYFKKNLRYIGFEGQGKQVRDFLHIQDFCDLILLQIEQFSRYRGKLFNVGGGTNHSLSLAETTRLCCEITGNRIPIESVSETRPADVRIYITDRRALEHACGWRPRRDARQTLSDIFHWLRTQENILKPIFCR